MTVKLDFSGKDLSRAHLAGSFLNGLVAENANFSGTNLLEANLVQSDLDNSDFSGANLSRTLLMYAEIKGCNFSNSDLTRANLMWANAQGSDFSNAKFAKTIFVEALLQNAKLGSGKADSFVKYAKTDGTSWSESAP